KMRAENPERVKIFVEHTPLGRPGTPDDIVGPAIFLASDLSTFVTGSIILADGGYRTVCLRPAAGRQPDDLIMRPYLTLALFIVVVLGGGTLIGVTTLPGGWYAGLIKPSFNPPNWVFAPVWTLLYLLIAIAGWRILQRDSRSAAMTAWFIQLGLNFIWSPVFFGAHRIGLALAIIVALLAAILSFIAT